MPPHKKKQNGPPIIINFGDISQQTIEFDEKEKQAFVLKGPPGNLLVVAWDIEPNGYGYYRIKVVGHENGKLVTKELEPGNKKAAFYGEASILGANKTELYASYSYEDDDQIDGDGIVINKVKEVIVRPRRKD